MESLLELYSLVKTEEGAFSVNIVFTLSRLRQDACVVFEEVIGNTPVSVCCRKYIRRWELNFDTLFPRF